MKKRLLLSLALVLSAGITQAALAASTTYAETEPAGATPKPGVNIEEGDMKVAPESEVPADATETEPVGVTPKPGVNIEERSTE